MTEYLTVREAAELLGVSRPRVWQFIEDGRLTPIRFGARSVLLSKRAIEEFAKLPRERGRKTTQNKE